jgi:hypothetical protein
MNKKTKMYVGVAVVAVAAYYFYMQSKKKETTVTSAKFVGASGDCMIKNGRQRFYGYNDGMGYCVTPQGTFRNQRNMVGFATTDSTGQSKF